MDWHPNISRSHHFDVGAVDILLMKQLAPAQARRGRRCEVCSLAPEIRTRIESALAQGVSLSRVSRSSDSPGRDSLRRHITSGHLAPAVQAEVERLHGLDSTTIAARIVDAARRAREVSLEAMQDGDRASTLRAIDTETRTLGMLATIGVSSETDAELAEIFKATTHAVYVLAQRDPATAEVVAAQLDSMHRPAIAEDIRDQFPETKSEIS